MNHIYRLVFNRSLKVMQVVSELTRSGHGGTAAATPAAGMRCPLFLACAAALLGLATT